MSTFKPRSDLSLFISSLRRRGRVNELPATDPGDQTHFQQVEQLKTLFPSAVNVIGNAQSLMTKERGGLIDAHLTIRFNSAQIINAKAQGSRWDIVASSNKNTISFYNETPPKFKTFWFTPYYDTYFDFLEDKQFESDVLIYPMRWSIELMALLKARPTTGMQVLFGLHKLAVSDVSIFGFDWKTTPTFYNPARKRDPHNHYGERKLCKKMIEDLGWTLYS